MRRIYSRAVATATTLLSQLETELNTRADAVLTGASVTSSSADGHSVNFAPPGLGGLESKIAELAEEMLTRYERAKADLGGSPTDAQIFAKMLASLYPVREATTTYASLRL